MKNKEVRIIILLLAVVAASGFLTALAISGTDESVPSYSTPPELTPPAPSEDAVSAVKAEGFWVSEQDGYIAVWHNADRTEPIESTAVAVRTLRMIDQELLREGVFFGDYMDVVMFLEDFCP